MGFIPTFPFNVQALEDRRRAEEKCFLAQACSLSFGLDQKNQSQNTSTNMPNLKVLDPD